MQWMLWTPPTAYFFIAMGVLLIGMTVWEIVQPNVERRGWIIPMRTTRGDRLFIALLVSAFICAFWVAVIQTAFWWVVVITVSLVVLLLWWG